MKHNINILLNTLENDKIEFKESLSLWKEIIETVSAFSNHKGGIILIGVKDNGSIIGLTIGKSTIEDITNKIKLNTEPSILPIITWQEIDNKTIIIIEVQEAKLKPVRAFGKSYKRVGKTNQIIPLIEESDLFLSTRGRTWDETIREDATLDDIDDDKIRKFLIKAKRVRNWDVDLDIPKKEILEKLDLMKHNKLTIASLLLFAKRPQKFLLQVEIAAARFKGKKKGIFIDSEMIKGDVISQVNDTMRFVKRNLRLSARVNGAIEREERWEYPIDALREVITNAICHRDYTSSSSVDVAIYDDRIEISNPGKLPSELTIEQLKKTHKSIPRNRLIAKAFYHIKYIEKWGTGILEMIAILKKNGFPEPEFVQKQGAFWVTIMKPKLYPKENDSEFYYEQLSKRREYILKLLNFSYNMKSEIEGILATETDIVIKNKYNEKLARINIDIDEYRKELKDLTGTE